MLNLKLVKKDKLTVRQIAINSSDSTIFRPIKNTLNTK